jgi:HK97 family phage major capsid protein
MANVIMDNRTILEKADLALSDLLSGGELVAAQAQKFIRLLIKESVILGMASVKPMKSKTQLVEKIRFSNRILRAGTEATPLPQADHQKPDLSKVELAAKMFKAQVNLEDEVLEDNIEQGSLRQTIMELMGEAISRDMDEILVQGDTGSSDNFLKQFDGMLVAATSNVVDGGTNTIGTDDLKGAIKEMPSEFIRNKRLLRFLTSVDAEVDLRDSYSDRETVAGDRFLQDDAPIMYSGIPVMDVPLFPENLGTGTNETNVILIDPKNIMVGIWRRIKMETDKDIEAGVLKIVASLRFDFKYVEETAVVKVEHVTVSA